MLAVFLEHSFTGDWVGDAKATSKVLEVLSDLIKEPNHRRPRFDDRVEIVPRPDKAIGAIAGLDQRDTLRPGHVALERLALACHELVFHAGLHPETHDVVGSHLGPPWITTGEGCSSASPAAS